MSNPYDPNADPHQAQNPQPYGQQYQIAAPEHPQGTTILVLGIVGLFFPLCAPFAWFMGSKALKEIRASGINYSNEQQIVIGRVLGIVITIIAIVIAVFLIVSLIIFLAALGTAAYSSG